MLFTEARLRLCCLIAMAPALTEAASQTQIKLRYCSPPVDVGSEDIVILDGLLNLDFSPPPDHSGKELGHCGSPAILAARSSNQKQRRHLQVENEKEIISLVHEGALVRLALLGADRSTSNRRPLSLTCLTTIGAATEIKRRLNGTTEGDGGQCPRSCTMNSSDGTDNNHSVDAMGMLKTSASLRLTTDRKGKLVDSLSLTESGLVPPSNVRPTTTHVTVPEEDALGLSRPVVDNTILPIKIEEPEDMPSKSDLVKQRLKEFTMNHGRLTRHSDNLRKRIQEIHVKQVAKHCRNQFKGLVNYEQKALQLPTREERIQLGISRTGSGSSSSSSSGSDIKSEFLQSENVKAMSTSALVSVVRKLEATHGTSFRQKFPYMTIQHLRSADKPEIHATRLPVNECAEIMRVSGTLQTNIRHLKDGMDSDCTESSSGGESCDELDGYDDKKMRYNPIRKRGGWKYAVNRAGVASRWTWLQAQVLDLEHRIRQHNDLYRRLRSVKGSVLLGDTTPPASSQSCSDTKSRQSVQVNGFIAVSTTGRNGLTDQCDPAVGKQTHVDGSKVQHHTDSDSSCVAARTRPLLPLLRKRKLVFAQKMLQSSKKVQRLSTVPCRCLPPVTPCVLCVGRVNYMQTLDPDTMSHLERIGLLDSSFHPVLSFKQEQELSLQFEVFLKNGDWQKAAQKPKPIGAVKKKPRIPTPVTDHVHKRSRKLKKNAQATLTAKLKKTLNNEKRTRTKGRSLSIGAANNKEDGSSHLSRRKKHDMADVIERERSFSGSSGSSSKPSSPAPCPSPADSAAGLMVGGVDHRDHPRRGSSMLHDLMLRKRRLENAFDINNIVIPYSMAAATRVERLQYKEILTPKWRLVEELPTTLEKEKDVASLPAPNDNGLVVQRRNSADEELDLGVEETSDDAVATRHDICEQAEKKRFMSFMIAHPPGRARSRPTRCDSRADSSGANTPDPMSPYPVDYQDSPLTTPPSTPAPHGEDGGGYITRRRTTSLSKTSRLLDEYHPNSPEVEAAPVPPWEQRTFPLCDEEYEELQKCVASNPPESPQHPFPEPEVEEANAEDVAIDHNLRPNRERVLMASAPESPASSSSGSMELDDDPNDPEWTVASVPAAEKGPRPGIVIKLAKR